MYVYAVTPEPDIFRIKRKICTEIDGQGTGDLIVLRLGTTVYNPGPDLKVQLRIF